VYQFNLAGNDGGNWQVLISNCQCQIKEGTHPSPNITISMAAQDYVDMVNGNLDGATAFAQGRLGIAGDLSLGVRLQDLFNAIAEDQSKAAAKNSIASIPEHEGTESHTPLISVDSRASQQNEVLFHKMIDALLAGDADTYEEWRDRLYATSSHDAHEYVARTIHASYSCGQVPYISVNAVSIQTGLSELENEGAAPYLEEQVQALRSRYQTLVETIRRCIDAIIVFANYDRYPALEFSFAGGNWTDGIFHSTESARQRLADLQSRFDAINDDAINDPIGEASQERGIALGLLAGRIGFLIQATERREVQALGLTQVGHLLLELQQLGQPNRVFWQAATALEQFLQSGVANSQQNTKIGELTARCVARVPAEEYAKIASSRKKAGIVVPPLSALPTANMGIHYVQGSALTLEGQPQTLRPQSSAQATSIAAHADAPSAAASSGSNMDPVKQLDAMVGLDCVKASVYELKSLVETDAERRKAGLPSAMPSLHAVFAGNPGTGKTTVARIYAKILSQLGYLSSGHLVEGDRGKLVSQYVGDSARKTSELLQRSLGGVLFIDEAYSLKQNDSDAFGQEAIDTLLKFMEDHRDDLVVVLAGYTEEIGKLVESNPGFKSRFNQYIPFEDYNDEQLATIMNSMADAQGFAIAPNDVALAVEFLKECPRTLIFSWSCSVINALRQQQTTLGVTPSRSGRSAP
jgi:hypothetical protein